MDPNRTDILQIQHNELLKFASRYILLALYLWRPTETDSYWTLLDSKTRTNVLH